MNRHTLLWLMIDLATVMFLGACTGAIATPTATPIPPTPTLSTIKVGETELQNPSVKGVEQVLDMKASTGFRLLEVSVSVSRGTPNEVAKWEVSLRDSAGNLYSPLVSSTGIYCAGVNPACWTFSVPQGAEALSLILPDGVGVDLAPLIVDD